MQKLKTMLGNLNREWLIRHYAFSFGFFILFLFASMQQSGRFDPAFLIFLPGAVMYPFAMFVYESLVNLIMGDNVFLVNGWLMLIWKIVRFLVIWTLAVPIGLVGFLYLYFVYGRQP